MIRGWLALGLAGCLACAQADEPQLRVQAQLLPAGPAVVGQTLQLQLDVLTDTWFTAAPKLPTLVLPGADVISPNGEAQNLTLPIDGKRFSGMRFHYLLTPHEARSFAIPGLSVEAVPGPASTPLSARTVPITLQVSAIDGSAQLVAEAVRLAQTITPSATPLKVGDSLARTLTLQADGALGLALPAPRWVDIDGLKAYPQPPDIPSPVTLDGQRSDTVVYQVVAPGTYRLPAITLQWWDSINHRMNTAEVPAQSFEAHGPALYQPVFSVAEDLKRLGAPTRIPLTPGLLSVLAGGLVIGLFTWLAKPAIRRLHNRIAAWREQRVRRWEASADYAWQCIPEQLAANPAQLSALYLWAWRALGKQQLADIGSAPLTALLHNGYASQGDKKRLPSEFKTAAGNLRSLTISTPQKANRYALRPLRAQSEKEFP